MSFQAIMQGCVDRAISLNNHAVSMLTYGASREAFCALKAALQLLIETDSFAEEYNNQYSQQPSIPSFPTAAYPCTNSIPAGNTSIQELVATQQHLPELRIEPIPICSSGEQLSESSYIYSQAIAFTGAGPVDAMDSSFFCAVLMFNMALTMHLQGKGPKDRSQEKALRLYDTTLELLGEVTTAIDCSNLKIAILNNKAQICYELCQYHKAHVELNLLLRAVGSSEKRAASVLSHQDLEGFLLNVMLLRTPTSAPAA